MAQPIRVRVRHLMAFCWHRNGSNDLIFVRQLFVAREHLSELNWMQFACFVHCFDSAYYQMAVDAGSALVERVAAAVALVKLQNLSAIVYFVEPIELDALEELAVLGVEPGSLVTVGLAEPETLEPVDRTEPDTLVTVELAELDAFAELAEPSEFDSMDEFENTNSC